LLFNFTKSRVFTVLLTASQMNWSQMELTHTKTQRNSCKKRIPSYRPSDAHHYLAYGAFTGVAVFRDPRNLRKLNLEITHRPKSVATAKNAAPPKAAMT
jgi:hypothetical protein